MPDTITLTTGRIWNAPPCDEVNFSSIRGFRNSLTAKGKVAG